MEEVCNISHGEKYPETSRKPSEQYLYPSEHGPSLEELQAVPSGQAVPTVPVQKQITKHPSLEHDKNNKTHHDQD